MRSAPPSHLTQGLSSHSYGLGNVTCAGYLRCSLSHASEAPGCTAACQRGWSGAGICAWSRQEHESGSQHFSAVWVFLANQQCSERGASKLAAFSTSEQCGLAGLEALPRARLDSQHLPPPGLRLRATGPPNAEKKRSGLVAMP